MTTLDRLGHDPDTIGNPHDVPPEWDNVLPVRRDVPGYSETAIIATWNPDEGIGLYLHFGRSQQDIDMWWAQVNVFLPDGTIASDRSYGRGPADNARVSTGPFEVDMSGPHGVWHTRFDGAAEITTASRMAKNPPGSGIARPVWFEFSTAPAGPIWDLYASLGKPAGAQSWATGSHTTQVLSISGRIRVNGVEYSLDGTGGNDHSSGPRHLGDFGHHHFMIGAYPGGTMNFMSVFSMSRDPLMETGSHVTTASQHTRASLIDVPQLTCFEDLDKASGEFTATILEEDGRKTAVGFEILHTAIMGANDDGDNFNGLLMNGPDVLTIVESKVKLTLPGGITGFGHLERSIRRSRLTEEDA